MKENKMKKLTQNKLYLYLSILVLIVAIFAIILGTIFGVKKQINRASIVVEITFHSKHGKEIAKKNFKLDRKIDVTFSNQELELEKDEEFLGWSVKQNGNAYISELKAKKEYTKLYPVFKKNTQNQLVNYKIVHYLEKQGKESELDNTYEKIIEVKSNQKVEHGANYSDYADLDKSLYEKDTLHPDNKLTAELKHGNNDVEVRQYYKLKEITVNFKKSEGVSSFTFETLKVKKTRIITLPGYSLKDTHNFIGWSETKDGAVQSEFVAAKDIETLELHARTEYQDREITYTVKKENVDGSFAERKISKTGKIASTHTVGYANPDVSVYQEPNFSVEKFTVSADKTQNKVTVTIFRKVYKITFEVKNHASSFAERTIRHGAKIGEIDDSHFKQNNLGIVKSELDGIEMTKAEIENFEVTKSHKVTLYIGKPIKLFGKYPQTKVDSPDGIQFERAEEQELKFNSAAVDYKLKFSRHYYKDVAGYRYELYNGSYYKFEDVEFEKIPEQDTWFTKKIIDFTPFNIFVLNHSDNAKPENSILKALVEDIGKILGGEVHMPVYHDSEFSVKPALDKNKQELLKKQATDYAKAVLNQYSGNQPFYRGADLNAYPNAKEHPRYDSNYQQQWWLGTKYNYLYPSAYRILPTGNFSFRNVHHVYGVVVCIK